MSSYKLNHQNQKAGLTILIVFFLPHLVVSIKKKKHFKGDAASFLEARSCTSRHSSGVHKDDRLIVPGGNWQHQRCGLHFLIHLCGKSVQSSGSWSELITRPEILYWFVWEEGFLGTDFRKSLWAFFFFLKDLLKTFITLSTAVVSYSSSETMASQHLTSVSELCNILNSCVLLFIIESQRGLTLTLW